MSGTSGSVGRGNDTAYVNNTLNSRLPQLLNAIPDDDVFAPPMRMVGESIWNCSFSDSGASTLSPDMYPRRVTPSVSYSQANGALSINMGVGANAEFLVRSLYSWRGSMNVRASVVMSQRIASNNFIVMMADTLAEGANCTINSATSITVNVQSHGLTAANVGQFLYVGAINGASGIPGRYSIASIVDSNNINITVAGWPTTGTCTVDLFGRSHAKVLFDGTTATSAKFGTQRNGWANLDSTITTNTTAYPGTIMQIECHGREINVSDMLRASNGAPDSFTRGCSLENIPDDNRDLSLYLWAYNGSTAPASATTITMSFLAIEKYANLPVYIQGQRKQGFSNPAPVKFPTTSLIGLTPGVSRFGTVAAASIWYDDSSTNLAANASFTGTSRDVTGGIAATTAILSSTSYTKEIRVSAESDQAGKLWMEVSRDGTTWRRVKSVDTASVVSGGQYAEIIHCPSVRYWRCGFTNGTVVQTRFFINSVMMGA